MMDTQPSRESLMQRISALETELQACRGHSETTCSDDAFGKERQDLKREIDRQCAGRVLKASSSLHHAIFEIAGDALFIENERDEILDVNKKACELLGYRREELLIDKSPVTAFLWRNETDWPVDFVTGNVARIFGYSDEDFLLGRVVYRNVVHPEDIERVEREVATYSRELGQTEFTHDPYRIIAKDGTIHWVNDHTFTLLLHASENIRAAGADQQNGLIAGSGRILVMDDEDFIRELASAMLKKMGYDVVLAEDGQTALAMYRDALDAGRAFDAVILDLTIPGGMGGKETMRQLSALDPHVRAIVSSGYSNDPVMANYASYGFCGAVNKPYLVQEMSRALEAVIKG